METAMSDERMRALVSSGKKFDAAMVTSHSTMGPYIVREHFKGTPWIGAFPALRYKNSCTISLSKCVS